MKRHKVLLGLVMASVMGTIAQAQQRSPAANVPVLESRRVGRYVDLLNAERSLYFSGGAWWTNQRVLTQLGITEDQKARIERTFEAHRQNLMTNRDALEKEEAQLARLLEAETIDRGAVRSQVDRVIRARGDLERTNATMTLEMREHLTRAQWTQLQTETGAGYTVGFSWNAPLGIRVQGGEGRGGGRGPAPVPAPAPRGGAPQQ